MEMGMVGLGRMGGNMVLRLLRKGHSLVAYDHSEDAIKAHEAQGATGARSLEEFVKKLGARPRVMWVMVPSGEPTRQTPSACSPPSKKNRRRRWSRFPSC
jgi:6-phosphogluconate dehydrogenase